MGNATSRAEETAPIYLKDQYRLTVTNVQIKNSRNRVLCTIIPNDVPATRYTVRKEADDDSVVEYIQDPESPSSSPPAFLLRLSNDDEITFYFTFVMQQQQSQPSVDDPSATVAVGVDTVIKNLTFLLASTPKDMDTLVTREFNADPNLHKNPNVELVGDYSTAGKSKEQFEWSWKWRPPKADKDKGCGWRNTCNFVEYNQRAHRLSTLVSFSFWVQSSQRALGSPKSPSPRIELKVPPRLRLASGQSVDSRISESDTEAKDGREPVSPNIVSIPEDGSELEPTATNNTVKVDINYQRPGDDISQVEDGPVFRATIKALEQKTGSVRARMKKVLKKAEAAKEAQVMCNTSVAGFMEALREASSSNANAVQPALDHYFEKIAREILAYEKENAENLQKLIIDPISRLYSNEIKQVEAKREDFEKESRDYYNYVGRYLGQRQDSLKEKKRVESDVKYQSKRRNFELKRFDYSSFMQDLHGGRKDQEVLSQLTKYADAQANGYLATAKKVEGLMPQLEALRFEVKEADKEYQLLRTGREEKRRTLEQSNKGFTDPDSTMNANSTISASNSSRIPGSSETEFGNPGALPIPASTDRSKSGANITSSSAPSATADLTTASPRMQSGAFTASPNQNRFKGIRDLEDKDYSAMGGSATGTTLHRKEGLLWSLSRPGSHADPKGLNKQAWHKFWIVLDQGKLSEYVNWKQNLEPHMDPIDLRMASVREARNAERRFCFEVITPNFTRIYQAPSEEDMKAWILAINNALQSAFEGKSPPPEPPSTGKSSGSIGRELFGKSSSYHGHRSSSTSGTYLMPRNVARHATIGERPPLERSRSSEERPARLLQSIRAADAGNAWCADCGSDTRVEWVSINLGIIVCIECSGIHRSLGTHISKVRSLTLDTTTFTQDVTELLLQIGNRVSNMIWEATLDTSPGSTHIPKPSATSPRDVRLRFITAKYVDRAFVRPAPAPTSSADPNASRPPNPDDILLASIKKSDIQGVLSALFSLRANPNAADRSRAAPAVYLALAAADPASPHQTQDTSAKEAQQQTERKSFPVAELLLQNGGEIPTTPAPFPLGKHAKSYLDFKIEQRSGKQQPPLGDGSAVTDPVYEDLDNNGDRLTALPSASSGASTTTSSTKRSSGSNSARLRPSLGVT